MAPPSSKRRSVRKPRPGSKGGGLWRTVLAFLLLVVGVAVVVTVARLGRHPAPLRAAAEQPVGVVREVAQRHGCAADAVAAEELEEPEGDLVVVTVHAPRGFAVERFALDLQARVHNLGGQVSPRPLGERGGYGLARLEGRVGDLRWRVLVLGEPARPAVRKRTPPPPREAPAAAASGPLPRLAIVLDDAGNSLADCEALASLPREVAVAVLPNVPHSTAVARCLAAQGRELLLHLPMQPLGDDGSGPGAGAIEITLTPQEVQDRLDTALERVPGARGVNNHMGSLATADRPTMTALAAALQQHGLYFLDSRTTPETVAETVMGEHGVPALRRDVFLDVVDEPSAISRALDQAANLASSEGGAVAIGHVHPATLAALALEMPELTKRVRLVPPSALLPLR